MLKANINFNDSISTNNLVEITNAASSLTSVLTSLQTELPALIISIEQLRVSLNEGLANAFTQLTREGNIVNAVLQKTSESIGVVSDVTAILASLGDAIVATESIGAALGAAYGNANAFVKLIPSLIGNIGKYIASLTASKLATDLHTLGTNIASAACVVWNAVLNLSPLTKIIAILTLVTAGIILLAKHMNKASEPQKRLNAETQALKESTDELNKSLEESKAAYAASTSKIETNAGAAEILAQKIYALSGEENKSAKAKRWLSALVERLNSTMPGRNLLYNAEADCLSQTTEQEVVLMTA